MIRKRISTFLLGIFFVACGVAVILERYRQNHPLNAYDDHAISRGALMIGGGVIGIIAAFISGGRKKP